jgi:hypothetical protein
MVPLLINRIDWVAADVDEIRLQKKYTYLRRNLSKLLAQKLSVLKC